MTTPIPSERKPYLPYTIREETLPALHRGCDYTHTIREETLPALYHQGGNLHPYRQRGNFSYLTSWVWLHPYHQRGNLTCLMSWVWLHPYHQRGNLTCLTLGSFWRGRILFLHTVRHGCGHTHAISKLLSKTYGCEHTQNVWRGVFTTTMGVGTPTKQSGVSFQATYSKVNAHSHACVSADRGILIIFKCSYFSIRVGENFSGAWNCDVLP